MRRAKAKEGVWQSSAVHRLHMAQCNYTLWTKVLAPLSHLTSPSRYHPFNAAAISATQICVLVLRAPYSSGTVSSLETQSYNTTHMQIIDRHNWERAG